MNKEKGTFLQKWLAKAVICVLLLLLLPSCAKEVEPTSQTILEPTQPPSPTELPPTQLPEQVPEQNAAQSLPEQPVIEPTDEIIVEAGKRIAIQASSNGADRYEWTLQGDGEISSSSEPAILYTAPDEGGGIAILTVTAYNERGSSSPTSLLVNIAAGEVQISLEIKTPEENAVVQANTKIPCNGSYSFPAGVETSDIHVWIVLKDDYGNYFLQNPPVTFIQSQSWETTGVQPGPGITQLLAVQVNQEGHLIFRQKVENKEWGAFVDLPEGSEILDSVNITSQ